MQDNYIKKVLRIEDEHLKIKQIETIENDMHVHLRFTQGYQLCPHCGSYTSKVHDYRDRVIKHGVINGYHVYLKYRRRRYVCKHCHKRFPEPNQFVERFNKISNVTKHHILREAEYVQSYTAIAKRLNVSVPTAMRHIDKHIQPSRLKLSETISIDEFKKRNLGYGKYAFVICDPINKKVIDVMRNRRTDWLKNYFSQIPYEERSNVKNVIMDLWAPYRNIVKAYLPHARIIADTFHFLRYIYWSFNAVRIRIMKTFDEDSINYKILKKHWKLLMKSPSDLNDTYYYHHLLEQNVNDYVIHDIAANLHPDLKEAFHLKDLFQTSIETLSYEEAPAFINQFIDLLRHATTKEFRDIKKTFINWRQEIVQSFDLHPETRKKMTNGIVEGINNFIKVIKRTAYGFTDFNRFRSRILFLYNKDYTLSA